jgi:hypothetical protein
VTPGGQFLRYTQLFPPLYRWGRLTGYFQREENQDQIIGKVIDINLTKEEDRPFMDYCCKDFQTMKNHKIVPCIFPAGENYVSLGCVDFAQLLFGIFDEDLNQDIHFYGVDCSLVSIVRCKVLYKMILNKAPSRLE